VTWATSDGARCHVERGGDLYGEELSRITTGMEFHAGILLEKESSPPIPTPAWLCRSNVNGGKEHMGDCPQPHANRANVSLPQTREQVMGHRPTGAGLMMVWETLTHGDMG
jgi:hypothetical protein